MPSSRIQDPGELADVVVSAVLAVPGVTRMHTGAFGEVATHLAGRRVSGVRLTSDETEVHVAIAPGTDIHPTASAIKTAVAALVGTPIAVYIEDIDVEPLPSTAPDEGA